MQLALDRQLDLAQLAADIQHSAALESIFRKQLPYGDLPTLRHLGRTLDAVYYRMIRSLDWIADELVKMPADALIADVGRVLTESGIKPHVVTVMTRSFTDRGGPAAITADAGQVLRESYQRHQDTMRQLESGSRPSAGAVEFAITATGAAQCGASVAATTFGAITMIYPIVGAGVAGEIAYCVPIAVEVVGDVINWITS